jgi:hypothetical protein
MVAPNAWSQWGSPQPPSLTEKKNPPPPPDGAKYSSLTDDNAGVSFELVKILYSKGEMVYIHGRPASRSQEKADPRHPIHHSNLPSTRVEKTIDVLGILKFFYYLDLDGISLRLKPSPPPRPFAAQEFKLNIL